MRIWCIFLNNCQAWFCLDFYSFARKNYNGIFAGKNHCVTIVQIPYQPRKRDARGKTSGAAGKILGFCGIKRMWTLAENLRIFRGRYTAGTLTNNANIII